jgi:hypothetical protein
MNKSVKLYTVALTVLCACSKSEVTATLTGEPIQITRLRSEPYSFTFVSGMDRPARLVIRDANSWQAIWTQINLGSSPLSPPPSIDFSREMVVVAALGAHSAGGYSILVDGASVVDSTGTAVAIRSVSPGPDCIVTDAFTQPVDIARMQVRSGPVTFVERSEVASCK